MSSDCHTPGLGETSFVLLCGLAVVAPALAQNRGAEPMPATPQTPVASTQYRYSPDAQLMADGRYRAEVRRQNAATGQDEIAWSSAPYSTMTDAMREACTTIQTTYDPNRSCRPAQQQQSTAPPGAGDAKKATSVPEVRKLVAKKAMDPENQVKRTTAGRPAASPFSGYEVPGCAFYALVGTRVVQHCPRAGASDSKPFWYNNDAFEGGYGGGAN
jgi:hypothetical protein